MLRLSRWGRSPYETKGDIALEVEDLSRWVKVVPERDNAEIAVIHSKIRFGPSEHKLSPDLQLLVTTTSGTDHIDLEYFRQHGIAVARLPVARRDAVVDTAVGMLIWGLRRMGAMDDAARRGRWARAELPGLAPVGLRGSRIGVVGLGVIGRQMCRVLAPFGVELWGSDPAGLPDGIQAATLPEMMGHCDAVTLHCSLGPSSANLLSAGVLGGAHPDLFVVNTARGGLLDLEAALQMLGRQQLGGLAIDVFPSEPWPQMASVQDFSNLMLHPHAAGYHRGLALAIRQGLCDAVQAFALGNPLPHRL